MALCHVQISGTCLIYRLYIIGGLGYIVGGLGDRGCVGWDKKTNFVSIIQVGVPTVMMTQVHNSVGMLYST